MIDRGLSVGRFDTINDLLSSFPDMTAITLVGLAACVSVLVGIVAASYGKRLAENSGQSCNCISCGLIKTFLVMWSFIGIICFTYNALEAGFLSIGVLICLLMIMLVKDR
jgi:hypothetical protein